MTHIEFVPKDIIPPEVCRLEVLDADKSDTYGPQIYLKLRIVGGEHDGHQFNDYSSRDENTGQIKQGTKAWSIFEACLGRDFYKKPGVSLGSLIGKQFMGQVTATKTGSRNKVEFGTIGPVPSVAPEGTPRADDGDDDETFEDIPL